MKEVPFAILGFAVAVGIGAMMEFAPRGYRHAAKMKCAQCDPKVIPTPN
jgi:hypothetical protein